MELDAIQYATLRGEMGCLRYLLQMLDRAGAEGRARAYMALINELGFGDVGAEIDEKALSITANIYYDALQKLIRYVDESGCFSPRNHATTTDEQCLHGVALHELSQVLTESGQS